ncbi:hypothetical protein B566_EDAN013960, partial [Ephemera danica]
MMQINLPGYEIYRVDRTDQRGGGVAIYVRSDIKCKIIATSNPLEKLKPEFIIAELKFGYKKAYIKSIKTKAAGHDELNIDLINHISDIILPAITILINESIKQSRFPNEWKKSLIKPIPKHTNATEIKDFRPISILPVLSKIIEKIVHDQITQFLLRTNQTDSLQSGFKAKHSTATA